MSLLVKWHSSALQLSMSSTAEELKPDFKQFVLKSEDSDLKV